MAPPVAAAEVAWPAPEPADVLPGALQTGEAYYRVQVLAAALQVLRAFLDCLINWGRGSQVGRLCQRRSWLFSSWPTS